MRPTEAHKGPATSNAKEFAWNSPSKPNDTRKTHGHIASHSRRAEKCAAQEPRTEATGAQSLRAFRLRGSEGPRHPGLEAYGLTGLQTYRLRGLEAYSFTGL